MAFKILTTAFLYLVISGAVYYFQIPPWYLVWWAICGHLVAIYMTDPCLPPPSWVYESLDTLELKMFGVYAAIISFFSFAAGAAFVWFLMEKE